MLIACDEQDADQIFMVFGIPSNYVLCTEELDEKRWGHKRVGLSIVK